MKHYWFPSALLISLALGLVGCGDDGTPTVDSGTPDSAADAAVDGDTDGSTGPVLCTQGDNADRLRMVELRWTAASIGMTPGVGRIGRLQISNDLCVDLEVSFTVADESIATAGVANVTIPATTSRGEVVVTGVAVGATTITASAVLNGGTADEVSWEATLDIVVASDEPLGCDGSASGNVAPGGEIAITSGAAMGARIVIPAGASRDDQYHVDAFDVTVGCAPDQIPDGFVELGPAITFGPEHSRFSRELPLTIPIKLALMQEGANRGHVQMTYTGPGVTEPRLIPVASPWFEGPASGGVMHFQADRLGTYQAVINPIYPISRERDFTFAGITGVSMGAGGAATIGMNNPERFDFIAPLGGPVDWVSLLEYIRTYHMGGFCTEAERAAGDTTCDDGASVSRVPDSHQTYEFIQDFEHWYYVDEYEGQGGTFDREEYIQIFRDLAMMFGNLNTTRSADPTAPNVTPPGVPDSRRGMSDEERCANPLRIAPTDGSAATGYFDDEYNPAGTYPVITVCDGVEIRMDGDRDIGVWDPVADQVYPLEVAWAVDINDNGRRDAGEPIIRAGRENFADCGVDQVCSADEAGYDAVTNPDPAGDDYHYQYNPTGTENNWMREGEPCGAAAVGSAELFEDTGLDGVMGTPQVAEGGFDFGEGDGCWTMSGGWERMVERNPRGHVLEDDLSVLENLDIFSDGGIRDLFNFSVIHNHFIGSFAARGLPVNIYNSHAALNFDGTSADADFKFARINWAEPGKYIHIRYGDPDASEGQLTQGDGGHVGTPTQIVNRLLSVLAWFSQKWPDGDRRRVIDRICTEVSGGCTVRNQFTFDFTSPTTGRTGPVSVVLPPGYSHEDFAETRFPIVYLGHGYGQEPDDLITIGIILWNFMTARTIPEAERLQKMIFVFPDGRCRGEECIQGTFYADAPESTPNGAQMETFMLDLMDHMDENYRTRRPSTHTIVE